MNATIAMMLQLAQGGGRPDVWIYLMAAGFAAICVVMMLVVLIQKPKGGGLSGAFGGGAGGGSEGAFIGGKVGDFLTWTTVLCFLLFLALAMGMTWAINGKDLLADDADEQEQAQTEDAGAPDDEATQDAGPESTDSE